MGAEKALFRWLTLIYLVVESNTFTDSGSGSSLPNYYKTHRIRTDQLCPDLQESLQVKDIDTANYPYKSVFRLADRVWKPQDPCFFESRGPRKQSTTLMIKAIRAEFQQWNFSGAQPCPEHIKLRLPAQNKGLGLFSRAGVPLCTVRKPTTAKYHPHVWQLSRQKMGISFAIYENDLEGEGGSGSGGNDTDSSSTSNESPQPLPWFQQQQKEQQNKIQLQADQNKHPRFVHIVFITFYGEMCSLRVQQYLVDPLKEQCNSSTGRFYALCGMYNCSEDEKVMRQAGFWSENPAVREREIYNMIEFLRTKPFRFGHEPTLMDFFLNLLRLMVMPMVFLMAYYVSRQLREKLANRQILSQLRTLNNERRNRGGGVGGTRIGVGGGTSIPRLVEGSPSSGRRFTEDLPPPYETIITPPSYLEAIQIPKPQGDLNNLKSLPTPTFVIPPPLGFGDASTTSLASVTSPVDDSLPSYDCAVAETSSYVVPGGPSQRGGNRISLSTSFLNDPVTSLPEDDDKRNEITTVHSAHPIT